MGNSGKASKAKKDRRRWKPEEKARIVRRYLRDKVSLADLADETGASPAQICQWTKALLESAEDVFSGELKKEKRAREKEIKKRDVKIVQLQEVVAELSSEVLRLKKEDGAGFLATMSRPR
jgi:transposase-like protein